MKRLPQTIIFALLFTILSGFGFTTPIFAYYTNMPASVVIGQPDFTGSAANQGGSVGANTLSIPFSIATDGTKLFVADDSNNRVLIWNHIPTSNNTPADIVLGQPDFMSNTANNGGISASTLNGAGGVLVYNGHLFVADESNHRVLIWNSIPKQNQQPADVVIGQADLTHGNVNQGRGFFSPLANTLADPDGLFVYQDKLFIGDTANNRVLIFNSIPTSNNVSADIVVGQNSMTTTVHTNDASHFIGTSSPRSIAIYQGKLIVPDSTATSHRVLIWNQIPVSNGVAADVVIGQPDFNSSTGDNGGVSCSSINFAEGVSVISNGRLVVGDNGRLLIWNQIPNINFAPANLVIGQPNCNTRVINNGGISNTSLGGAQSNILEVDQNLIVADRNNNRILIYLNQLPNVSLSRTISAGPTGLYRFTGTASTNVTNEIVKQVEYSINGSTWTGAFPTDGKWDSATEQYYFDFDPRNNNMADNQGYTIKIRSSHGNDIDTSKAALYFQPFVASSPANNTFTQEKLPTFTFNIQKLRVQDLKENLDHFRISISTDNQYWSPYIDNIPVDYNSVRLNQDNLQPNPKETMNGIYEDKYKVVQYDQDNSRITVTSKAIDSQGNPSDKDINNGGKLLANNTYYWRVEAEDHAGQIQYTDPNVLRIGTRQVVKSRSWFPLMIKTIGGGDNKIEGLTISTENPFTSPTTNNSPPTTNNPQPITPYSLPSPWPWFWGVATAGSTVTFKLTDTNCPSSDLSTCTTTNQTITRPDSTFLEEIHWALPSGTYTVTASVKDTGDNYNELPPFTLTIASPSATP